jgi:hypothetical protein
VDGRRPRLSPPHTLPVGKPRVAYGAFSFGEAKQNRTAGHDEHATKSVRIYCGRELLRRSFGHTFLIDLVDMNLRTPLPSIRKVSE